MINKRILIANRALSALKFINSINDDKVINNKNNITLIGIITDNDIKSNYLYIKNVDEIIHANNDIFTNIEDIIIICKKNNIDMVWPGWGYLSEIPEFSKRLSQENITFIGPSHDILNMVGNKIESMILAEKYNVPVINWSKKAINDIDEAKRISSDIGFPVMIKHAEGGGGKGIRCVHNIKDFNNNWKSVLNECGGNEAFIMKLVENCRHIEVQFLSDGKNAMHLFTRDCTLQRRNQKLIEEGPAPIPDELNELLQNAAVNFIKSINYIGVGTMEFLYKPDDNTFTFLEINPRLQVEHTVSELITNTNIPMIQVYLALGYKTNKISYLQNIKKPTKHVIAARINSENPFDNFTPCSGTINSIIHSDSKYTLAYFSIDNNGKILDSMDNQFGHIFAIGENRDIARKRLINTIQNLQIRSQIPNTANFLKELLKDNSFINIAYHTQWLQSKKIIYNNSVNINNNIIIILGLITKTIIKYNENKKLYDILKERGHSPILQTKYSNSIIYNNCEYNATIYFYNNDIYIHYINENNDNLIYKIKANISLPNIYISINSLVYVINILKNNKNGILISINNTKFEFPIILDKSLLSSTLSGKIIEKLVEDNNPIEENQPYLIVESMKMQITLNSTSNGTIKYLKSQGDHFNPGDIIAKVENSDENNNKNKIPKKFITELDINNIFYEIFDILNNKNIKNMPKNKIKLNELELAKKRNTSHINILINMFKNYDKYEINIINNTICKNNDNKLSIKAFLFNSKTNNNNKFILIINDITNKYGSFGHEESNFFCRITEYCIENNYPRIYISSTSGARLDTNDELKHIIKPMWEDENNFNKGFKYLYLLNNDYIKHKNDLIAEKINYKNEIIWKIKHIKNNGTINLNFASETAALTSKAYNNIFTITYVSGLSVGIGSYIARLSNRVIQKSDSPLLLTGFNALNNVLGEKLYKNNLEIGGPQIMANNGISQLVVDNDQDGINMIEKWLDYYFKNYNTKAILNNDNYFYKIKYDNNVNNLITNFFDKKSTLFTMNKWANTVITGRAKIASIPVGFIIANHETVTKNIPNDPANLDSSITNINQSGSIWHPDSSYKTAQTIQDCNREKLPLFIFVNWRGFSGGTKDMYDEVLKFGSYIVDNLSTYDQPIYNYILPNSQIRGGAMVVIGKKINSDKIKWFSSPDTKLNILEPELLKSIKFKNNDLLKCIEYNNLDSSNHEIIKQFEKVAYSFCDLHDNIDLSNDFIEEIVEWENSRNFFIKELCKDLS